MKRPWVKVILVLLVIAAGYGIYSVVKQFSRPSAEIATARVAQGDVVVRSFARGELRAVRTVSLMAPNLFGTIQVTKLAPLGALAHYKDLIVEFDDSEVLARLDEKKLELEQTNEQIAKAEADLAIRNNQDQVDLLSTGFDVRRAQLEVGRNELLSAIDAKKNVLTLDESKRRLTQLESDIKSRQAQAEAELAVLRANREKATLELNREQQRLSQVKLLAPMNGLVAIRQNRTGFFFPGMEIPDIREGDQLQPGIPVADILDLSDLEVVARVGELDRANLHEGQEALIRLDALPDHPVHGYIKNMSGQASANVFSLDPQKKFDVIFSVNMNELLTSAGAKPGIIAKILATGGTNRSRGAATTGNEKTTERPRSGEPKAVAADSLPGSSPLLTPPSATQRFSDADLERAKLPSSPEDEGNLSMLLRPGLLGDVQIIVEKIPNALHIPAQAVFEKEGRRIVYVKSGSGFEPRPITTSKRSESVFVVSEGLKRGEVIALADPTAKRDNNSQQKKGGAMGALPVGAQ